MISIQSNQVKTVILKPIETMDKDFVQLRIDVFREDGTSKLICEVWRMETIRAKLRFKNARTLADVETWIRDDFFTSHLEGIHASKLSLLLKKAMGKIRILLYPNIGKTGSRKRGQGNGVKETESRKRGQGNGVKETGSKETGSGDMKEKTATKMKPSNPNYQP